MNGRARVGDVLAERYELRDLVRTSQLGQDFSAWDRAARQSVTIAIFDRQIDPEAIARHDDVTRQVAGVHRAIVLPRHLVGTNSPQFSVYEALRGADLDSLRNRCGALLWPRAAEVVATAAEALAAVHRVTDLAHRIIHPSSIWITEAAEVRLLDFGAAEFVKAATQARASDVFVEYRAPEQVEGASGDARSDVFTLAVILLEAATGVHPYSGPSAYKAAHKVIHQAAAALDVCEAGAPLPPQARALLHKALARRAEDRFADPGDFLRSLTIVRQAAGTARAGTRIPAQIADPDVQEATAAFARDATTMIRIPAPRSAKPQSVSEQDTEQSPDSALSSDPCLAPPLIGGSSNRQWLSAKSRQEVASGSTTPQPLPSLSEDDNATTAFTLLPTVEKTEVLTRPHLPPVEPVERTERLPGAAQRNPVEPTLVLPENRPVSPPRRTTAADATVCERRPEPQATLLLPRAAERILWSPPRPQPAAESANQRHLAPVKPGRPSRALLLLNLLLAAFIFYGIMVLLAH